MAIAKWAPRVKQSGQIAAGGVIELGSAATGFVGFGDVAGNGDRVSYWVTKGSEYQYGGADFATGSPATLTPSNPVLGIGATGDTVEVSCAPQPHAGPELIFAAHVSNYDLTATGFGSGARLNFATGTIEYDPYGLYVTTTGTNYATVYLNNYSGKMLRASLYALFGEATGATLRKAEIRFSPGLALTLPQTTATGLDLQSGSMAVPVGSAQNIAAWFEHTATGPVTVTASFMVEAFN